MILVHGESQVQQLELSIISIQKISSRSTVCACAPHVLAQAIEGCAFFRISFWVISIGCPYILLQRVYPVDLVGLLERARDHGACLWHLCGVSMDCVRCASTRMTYRIQWRTEQKIEAVAAVERERPSCVGGAKGIAVSVVWWTCEMTRSGICCRSASSLNPVVTT